MTIDPKTTAKALEASIAAWKAKLEKDDPEKIKLGPDACPLCELFWHNCCEGCPVSNCTGSRACGGSPYDDATDRFFDWRDIRRLQDSHANIAQAKAKWQEACKAEIAFLESLREDVQ